MGKQIIKADRESDMYMEWSSVVDAPTFIGTREEVREYLLEESPKQQVEIESRLVRADVSGSSGHVPFGCTWDDGGLIYYQRGWLPRSAFLEFARRMQASRGVDDLLEPFED